MNLSRLKSYAQKARRDFIRAVTERAAEYGLTEVGVEPLVLRGDIALIGDRKFPGTIVQPRRQLEDLIQRKGFGPVIEELAYTWFNRIVAIRYMELHDFLGHEMRVLSHPDGQEHPEILQRAHEVNLPGLDRNEVVELKLCGTRDEKLYRLLILAQCNALHRAMPFLFDPIGSGTELLLPRNLLRKDSLVYQLVHAIDESAWNEIEIVGWLYQFYISERKDEVIGKVVASEDIPAATQLFTPNWIVKYLVQNSLGAAWLATYPESGIAEVMDYYIAPAAQDEDVRAALASITPETLEPEELALLDPAAGSGHILVEAYDLFKVIYLERGYRRQEIPRLILEKNLFGLDIDQRAAQLASFALMMKAQSDDEELLSRGVTPNIVGFVNGTGLDVGHLSQGLPLSDYGLVQHDLLVLKELFLHATTFGSLIQVPKELAAKLPSLRRLCEATSRDSFVSNALRLLGHLVRQTELLARRYDVIAANPPYMASKYHGRHLRPFLKKHYKGYDRDLFSAFIDRSLALSRPHGRLGFMSPFVWMFISTHEHLRTRLIDLETLTSLVQLEYSGFDGATVPICTFILSKGHIARHKGCFIRLTDFRGSKNQGPKTLEAIRNRDCGWFFEAVPDSFHTIPGSPIAYWVSERFRDVFAIGTPLGELVEARQGLGTANNDLFLRRWWEVDIEKCGFGMSSREEALQSGKKWFPCNKGGPFRKWYGNQEYLINWQQDGRAIRAFGTEDGGRPRSVVRNPDYYFREALTWSLVTSGPTSFRLIDRGSIHDTAGHSAFSFSIVARSLLAGYCNTPIVKPIVGTLNPTLNFQIGDFVKLPFIQNTNDQLAHAVIRNVDVLSKIARRDWNASEHSWDFQSNSILGPSSNHHSTIESSYHVWIAENKDTVAETKRLEEENNRLFIETYGLTAELSPEVPIEEITLTVNPAYRYRRDRGLTESERWARFRRDTTAEIVSYAVGCMMGRYSLDEPGLAYTRSDGTGFDPHLYSSFPADDDGIVPITDDAWFEDDAANRFIKFVATAWDPAHLEENLSFVAKSLSSTRADSSRDTLRRYFATGFYKDHLATYKKRPIYWLFTCGRGRAFQCLVYLHRYNEGTLARMRTEYVIPLQGLIASRIHQLGQDVNATTIRARRRRLDKEREKLSRQQEELRTFDEKLRYFADMRIRLDLDDGVKVNYGKFGDLLSDVKSVTGKRPESWK